MMGWLHLSRKAASWSTTKKHLEQNDLQAIGCSLVQKQRINLFKPISKTSMKIDFKKLDDEEVIFVNESWTPAEKKAFSEFLKAHRQKKSNGKAMRVPSRKPIGNRVSVGSA
jgi:hypothetical protein